MNSTTDLQAVAHAATQAARTAPGRVVRAPRGSTLSCKSWLAEAAFRMIQNNLDPEVAERPEELVVYGGIGRAARDWACFDQILASLRELEDDESLLIQSGKPVGVFRTHADAPRVLLANSNLVPKWATWEHFNELDRQGLFMYGQMTAGSWIYIGTQGIVQGTYETFAEAGRQHFGGTLAGRWVLTAGLGGMGGAQPLAVTMLRRRGVCVWRHRMPAAQHRASGIAAPATWTSQARSGLEDALAQARSTRTGRARGRSRSACCGNAAEVLSASCCAAPRRACIRPDVVTDQTSAHDPHQRLHARPGWTWPPQWQATRQRDPRA